VTCWAEKKNADDQSCSCLLNLQPRQPCRAFPYEGFYWNTKSHYPQLETVSYRNDNAGCHHSGIMIAGARLAGCCSGVSVERIDFSDPLGGKGHMVERQPQFGIK